MKHSEEFTFLATDLRRYSKWLSGHSAYLNYKLYKDHDIVFFKFEIFRPIYIDGNKHCDI
jgi:hypothetical protein